MSRWQRSQDLQLPFQHTTEGTLQGLGSQGLARAMQETELLARACGAADALVKRVVAIQHCFKMERLSRACSLLVMERDKSPDQTNWEGGRGWRGPSHRLSNEHYKLLK